MYEWTKILLEMVDTLFAKKWRKRAKYDFVSRKRRETAFFRYNSGEYLDNTAIKYNVTKLSEEEIYSLVQKEGGEQYIGPPDRYILVKKQRNG